MQITGPSVAALRGQPLLETFMKYIKGAFSIIVLVAIIVFSIQNLEAINVSFLSWSLTVPKFLVIMGNYVLGMITGAWLFDFLKHLLKSNRSD
jgi:uncharacterized integral membrane protein